MTQRAFFRIIGVAGGVGALVGCASQGPQTLASTQVIPMSAQGLVGATPQVLDAEFGKPELRRMDGSAQVWLYHSPVCGLNLFLYPDARGVPRVASAVPDNGNAPANCMQSLEHGLTDAALEPPASS